MAGSFTVLGTAQASIRDWSIISITDSAQASRLRLWIASDPSHFAGPSDRNMRRSSLFTLHASHLIVALLCVAVVESPARAQLLDSTVEATAEDPTPPSFVGPIHDRSKLTG